MARAKRTARAEARRRYRAAAEHRRTARRGRRREAARRAGTTSAARAGQPPATDGHRGRLPAVDPSAQRPRRPGLAAVARAPHQGALAAGADHDREHGRSSSRRTVADWSRCSCSRTSSRRRRSVACSSPASWRRGRAGCSARSSGCVAAICYSVLVVAVPDDDLHGGCRRRPDRTRDIVLAALVLSPVFGALLRRRRRVVPAVPATVEPESRPDAGRPEGRSSGRRPDPYRELVAEGQRQALDARVVARSRRRPRAIARFDQPSRRMPAWPSWRTPAG